MSRGGLCVRPKVDNDGSSRVEPVQAALRAAQVDLLHVSAMGLVAQATGEEKTDFLFTLSATERTVSLFECIKTCKRNRVTETYGRDLVTLQRSLRATPVQLSANKSLTLVGCGHFVSDTSTPGTDLGY